MRVEKRIGNVFYLTDWRAEQEREKARSALIAAAYEATRENDWNKAGQLLEAAARQSPSTAAAMRYDDEFFDGLFE